VYVSLANTVNYRRLFFSAGDCFLSGSVLLKREINYFIQVPENIENQLNEFYTLLADLSAPVETLWQNIYYRTRAEIQGFTANQAYEHTVQLNLPAGDLKNFIRLLNRFSKHKGIRKAETFRLNAYNKAGLLAVSFIKQQGQLICINFYRVNQQRATNLYSFHLKHELNGMFNNTHIGRAHRALHWLDMLEFKKMNIPHYDFCGWYAGNTDKQLLNINAFKEQFTQHKVKEYSGVIYKNKLLILLFKLRH
jgi:hypothetical protein